MGARLGFQFVPFPREIWDEGINLSHNGFRLLGYLIRHTVSFQNQQIRLTEDELLHGRKCRDGSRYDKGSGVKSPSSLRLARLELTSLGWIKVETDFSNLNNIKHYYEVCIETEDRGSKIGGSKIDYLEGRKSTPDPSKIDPPADPKSLARKDIQIPLETLKEETKKEETIDLDPPSTSLALVEAKPPEAKVRDPLLQSFLDLFEFDCKIFAQKDWFILQSFLKAFRKANVSVAQVEQYKDWHYKHFWKGQQGQPPTYQDVKANWKLAFAPAKPIVKQESQYETRSERREREWGEFFNEMRAETAQSVLPEKSSNQTNNNGIETGRRLLRAHKFYGA